MIARYIIYIKKNCSTEQTDDNDMALKLNVFSIHVFFIIEIQSDLSLANTQGKTQNCLLNTSACLIQVNLH